jgi:hypothetical protein
MKEEHAIAFLAVAGIAFMVGWQMCKKQAAQAAAAKQPAAAQGQGDNVSDSMSWLVSWSGFNQEQTQ